MCCTGPIRCQTLLVSTETRRCATCGRPLVASEDADGRDDPRMDCGGDCLWCVYQAEEGAPPEVRGPPPRGWPDKRW